MVPEPPESVQTAMWKRSIAECIAESEYMKVSKGPGMPYAKRLKQGCKT